MKKALMIIAIVAIIAITGSIIYYFVFFRPGIETAEIRLQEQKVTEESTRQENLEKCLKEAEDWKTNALKSLSGEIKTSSDFDRAMKYIQDEYQNKINNCNSKYGK